MVRIVRTSRRAICVGCSIVTGLALLGSLGCDDSGAPASGVGHDHHAMQIAYAELPADGGDPSGHSIFHLDSEWTTASGEMIRLGALGSRTQVVAMVYTSCEIACPRVIADMRAIKAAADRSSEELGFVLISIDPERDTPGRMSEFARRSGLDERSWTLLRGDDDSIRELAAVLGVRYRRINEVDFAHSNIISVLNRDGEIVHQQIGLERSPEESAEAIRLAIEGA